MDNAPIVLAPNAFKGTLSPDAAARAMAAGVELACPGRPVFMRPLPDGGDGTLEVLLAALGGERYEFDVTDACGLTRKAPLALLGRGRRRVAVIESAQVLGLALNPLCPFEQRTSRGVGELVRHALDCGAQAIYLGLGGSATCDLGAGFLTALGLVITETPGPAPSPYRIEVDSRRLDPRLARTSLVVLADVASPLLGPMGVRAFAAQKGAERALVDGLDDRLRPLAAALEAHFRVAVAHWPGSGAAGGIGFACALLGAHMTAGAAMVARLTGLRQAIGRAACVVTGEGACDGQTAYGKGPQFVAALARRLGRPTYLVCGRVDGSFAPLARDFARCLTLPPDRAPAQGLRDTVALLLS